jgi:hypothetical protein
MNAQLDLFPQTDTQQVIQGDCLEVMKQYPDNHFNCVLTDPPYGLKFMNKSWDHGIPGIEYWKELLRICKPGTMGLFFGGTRTYHRLTCVIEDAGWEIRDCLMYVYGSGFPKSHNHFGLKGYGTALKPAYEPILLCMKPLDGTYAKNVEKWENGGINIDGCRIESNLHSKERKSSTEFNQSSEWNKHKNIDTFYDASKGRWPANILFDEFNERILFLKDNVSHDIILAIKEYFHDYKLPNLPKRDRNLPKPSKEKQSQVLQQEMLPQGIEHSSEGRETFYVGKETQERINPKNATTTSKKGERESSFQGTLDEPRLPLYQPRESSERSAGNSYSNDKAEWDCGTSPNDGVEIRKTITGLRSCSSCEWSEGRQQNGEFRSNGQFDTQERAQGNIEGIESTEKGERRLKVLACDIPEKWLKYFEETGCEIRSPYCAAEMLDEQSGELKSGSGNRRPNGGGDMFSGFSPMKAEFESSSGGASRFFYCAKASSKERNSGLEGMADIPASCNLRSQGGLTKPKKEFMVKNSHPTVKPIKLLEYLLKLIAPANTLVIDPFLGSGSTLIAAKNLHISGIGIEKEIDYCNIAKKRIENWENE